jgi:hypothetical protein
MARATETVLKIAWLLAAAVCAFTVENIWLDPWLQRRSHNKLPSFVPEALGGTWFLILLALTISVVFLVVCQVLLMRDAHVSIRHKFATGLAVLFAALLSGNWFFATSGARVATGSSSSPNAAAPQQKRSVALRWQASTTPNVRYNIYRGESPGAHPDKLTTAPIDGTTFTDATVTSGHTYYYVVRSINTKGEESQASNEIIAKIP